MKNLMAGFAVAVLIACALVLFQQRQVQEKLRADNESLTQQIAQLKADNENLSNLAAQAKNFQSLPDEQFTELLKLRGEVGVLRQQLESQKQQIISANASKMIRAEASSYLSKNQLTNSGFDTPEAALQTYMHGILSDNYDQVRSTMASQLSAQSENAKDREDFEKMISSGATSNFLAQQILAKKIVSDDKIDLEVLVLQNGTAPDISIQHMVKEGGQWKFNGSANNPSWSKDGQVQYILPNQ